jgi:hypothetical protein
MKNKMKTEVKKLRLFIFLVFIGITLLNSSFADSNKLKFTEIIDKIEEQNLDKVHVVMNIEEKTSEFLNYLEENNIIRLYSDDNEFIVSVPVDKLEEISEHSNVVSIANKGSIDKLNLDLEEEVQDYLIDEEGRYKLLVLCYFDVELDDCKSVVEKYGGKVRKHSPYSFIAYVPSSDIISLASEDLIAVVEMAPPRAIPSWNQARSTIKIDEVYNNENLDGSGITVAIWEVGGVANISHPDFHDRITVMDGETNITEHATLVTGILAGDGTINNAYIGAASGIISILAYNQDDHTNELEEAIDLNSKISQNSWGNEIIPPNCDNYGDYGANELLLDEIIKGDIYNDEILIVFSAGNERVSQVCNITTGYNTITPPATAKNILTVGATYSDNDQSTCFSSWGPTDDGRIKPEVMAPGDEDICQAYPRIQYYLGNNDLSNGAGTSFAAPQVSGLAALLMQEYQIVYYQFYPSVPSPSTMRAVIIHGAEDIENIGPDYSSGFGRVDSERSVSIITDQKILERDFEELDEGQTHEFSITVSPDDEELKVTLVWDDDGSLDFNYLENDLALTLVSPENQIYYPWVLDPSNPSLAASRGIDLVNVVEQVYISNPIEGQWTIRVTATNLENDQTYSLVGTHLGYRKIFFINNEGNQDLQITSITPTENWLSVDQSSLIISPGDSEIVTASVDTMGMVAGTYTADITIESNDADEGTVQIPITLELTYTDNDGDGYYDGPYGNDPDDNDPGVIPEGNIIDYSPTVTLVSPSDNSESTSENVTFNCSATDDYNLVNMNLYHNMSGTWELDQIETLTGTSDYATFTVNNIPQGTTFVWNCQAYDNASQSDLGNSNYTLTVPYLNAPSNPTIIHPNGGEEFSQGELVTINWSQSNDLDGDYVSYLLEYSDDSGVSWNTIILDYGFEDEFDDGETEKRLTYEGNDDQTVYIRIPKNAEVLSAEIDLTGDS